MRLLDGTSLWMSARLAVGPGDLQRSDCIATAVYGGGVTLVARAGDAWLRTRMRGASGVDRAVEAVASCVGRDGVLVFLASLTDRTGVDQNSVHAMTLGEDGAWAEHVVLSRQGPRPARELNLLRGLSGEISVLWHEQSDDGGSRVRGVESRDAGRSWASLPTLTTGGSITGLNGAVGTDGRIHVVFERWDAEGESSRVQIATLARTWSTVHPVADSIDGFDAVIVTASLECVEIVFSGSLRTAGAPPKLQSFNAALPPTL